LGIRPLSRFTLHPSMADPWGENVLASPKTLAAQHQHHPLVKAVRFMSPPLLHRRLQLFSQALKHLLNPNNPNHNCKILNLLYSSTGSMRAARKCGAKLTIAMSYRANALVTAHPALSHSITTAFQSQLEQYSKVLYICAIRRAATTWV
jgi:hypothetical protein